MWCESGGVVTNCILVGNAEDHARVTGTTVVLAEEPAVAAVTVTGGGPGTRATTVLDPASVMTRVDAVALSGGSAFGLDAPGGALRVVGEVCSNPALTGRGQ